VLWLQQVMDVAQARQAVERGADVIIAQGGEAGGHSGSIGTLVLVPQVADVAGATPVVAAGGIADGRGLVAALALGAQGVCIGTRFLASNEMSIAVEWKRRIVTADAIDAVKVDNDDAIMPPYTLDGFPAPPRALDTPFIRDLREQPDRVRDRAGDLTAELLAALIDGRGHEYLPFTGQSAGLVHEILPAAEIVRRTIEQADSVLASLSATAVVRPSPDPA
jgi:nitronate monooxygenase/enoyl-[acyl-carrier protein] reductase II